VQVLGSRELYWTRKRLLQAENADLRQMFRGRNAEFVTANHCSQKSLKSGIDLF
jgi:hypothetical protein